MSFAHSSRLHRFVDAVFMHGLMKGAYKKFADTFDLKGSEKVLDFGGGTGALSRHVAERLRDGGSVVVLDASVGWIETGAKRLRRYRNIEFIAGDQNTLSQMKAGFDVITIHFMLHDIDKAQRQEAVNALSEALKPGGVLYIREPTSGRHGMQAAEIIDLMASADLRKTASSEGRAFLLGRFFIGEFRKNQ
ncbi:MAG TPA: class I SAM-dependent methyltransferase [Acidobacteriota bacterium]|nr:class I SAM-dependent methyltransferase [Acidobacteriota bacterium]